MFRVPNRTDGIDLISLDLARGREHGIPSYNKFRQLCGLNKAETFDGFVDQISREVSPYTRNTYTIRCKIYQHERYLIISKNIDALAGLYEHVDDVDFYAAGLLERPKPGSILGHTFQCIIGEMFWRWKFGDRYYYEFGGQPGSFDAG